MCQVAAPRTSFRKHPLYNAEKNRNTCTVLSLVVKRKRSCSSKENENISIGVFGKHLKRKHWSSAASDNKASVAIHPRVLLQNSADTVTEPTPYWFHGIHTSRPKSCQDSGRMPSDMRTLIL